MYHVHDLLWSHSCGDKESFISHFVSLQSCLNWWQILIKVLLRDFDSVTQLLQICELHMYDANPQFHHNPEMLCWILESSRRRFQHYPALLNRH